jgi:hypothetical protein
MTIYREDKHLGPNWNHMLLKPLQVTVTLSSTEAEYQAFTIAVQQIIYYRQVLAELGYCQDQPTVLFGDNKGALSLAVTTKDHTRSKHIDIKHHFLRDCVKNGSIQLIYNSTAEQLADMFTKPLSYPKLSYFRTILSIQARGVLEPILCMDPMSVDHRTMGMDHVI